MTTSTQKLAKSLQVLKTLQEKNIVAIRSRDISRTHKERLLKNGFIKEVFKGWYITASPTESKGDSTSWYNAYWNFCSQLLQDKFKQSWCISPEQSLILHAGNWSVPNQLIIKSPKATNFKTDLPFNTSLFYIKANLPEKNEQYEIDGIRMHSMASAMVKVSENTFIKNPTDVRTVLSLFQEPSALLALLLKEGRTVVAGRLAGAFRNINRNDLADEILVTMRKAGNTVKEYDPFTNKTAITFSYRNVSPYANRVRLMWEQMRSKVIEIFPKAPGLPKNKSKYLKAIEKIYVTDAYHSLSIEKYKVTEELIEKVKQGKWNFHNNEEDRQQRDAMAAKGYWEAFQAVEKSISKILGGENAGKVVEADQRKWYRELFSPGVNAGILKPEDLAGYRNHQVYISQSKHVPLNKDGVRNAMPVLFELLQEEPEAAVRAVLGHFIFVFIHPYMDGNGRMGRFLMNAMLASGGYPWTVIPVEQRDVYMQALEKASVEQDIAAFAEFLNKLLVKS